MRSSRCINETYVCTRCRQLSYNDHRQAHTHGIRELEMIDSALGGVVFRTVRHDGGQFCYNVNCIADTDRKKKKNSPTRVTHADRRLSNVSMHQQTYRQQFKISTKRNIFEEMHSRPTRTEISTSMEITNIQRLCELFES